MNPPNRRVPRKILGNVSHQMNSNTKQEKTNNYALLQRPTQIPAHGHMHPPPQAPMMPPSHMPPPHMQPPGTMGPPPQHACHQQQQQQQQQMRVTNIVNHEAHHPGFPYGPHFLIPPPHNMAMQYPTYGPMSYYNGMQGCQHRPPGPPPISALTMQTHGPMNHVMPPNNGGRMNSSPSTMPPYHNVPPPPGFSPKPCAPIGNSASLVNMQAPGLTQRGGVSVNTVLNSDQVPPNCSAQTMNKHKVFTFGGDGDGDKVNPICTTEEGKAKCEKGPTELSSNSSTTYDSMTHLSSDSDVNSSPECGGHVSNEHGGLNVAGAGGKANMILPVDTDEDTNIPMSKYKELTRLALRGSEIAEKLSFLHRSRPCFKKIDSLCARMKQDLIRPDGVLPNINSQGYAWAVKDFIFVFTRIINAWIIIKGYVFNTPEGLKKVTESLDDDFLARFYIWQDATYDFADSILKSFINLDILVQSQKNVHQKPDGKNSTTPSASTAPEDLPNSAAETGLPATNYEFTMVEDSEASQRQATANGTYFKTGTYNPIKKDESNGDQSSSSSTSSSTLSVPSPTSAQPPEATPSGDPLDAIKNILMTSDAPISNNVNFRSLETNNIKIKNSNSAPQSNISGQNTMGKKTLNPQVILPECNISQKNENNASSTSTCSSATDISQCDSTIQMNNVNRVNKGITEESSGIGSSKDSTDGIGKALGNGCINDAGSKSLNNAWYNVSDSRETLTVDSVEILMNQNRELQANLDLKLSTFFSDTKMKVATETTTATVDSLSVQPQGPSNWPNLDEELLRILNENNKSVQPDLDVVNENRLDLHVEGGRKGTNKLDVVVERLMELQHADYFFRLQFTRNYFPDFSALHENRAIKDVRAIISKCHDGGYMHVFEVVHDIRMLIFAAKAHLKEYSNQKLQTAIISYEAEIDQLLSVPPFDLNNFQHLTGDPDEPIYLRTSPNQYQQAKHT